MPDVRMVTSGISRTVGQSLRMVLRLALASALVNAGINSRDVISLSSIFF
jgi:hypothetical protein